MHGSASLTAVASITLRALAHFDICGPGISRLGGHGGSQNNIPNGHPFSDLVQSGADENALNVRKYSQEIVSGGLVDTGTLNIPPVSLNQWYNIDMAVRIVSVPLPRQGQSISTDNNIITAQLSRACAFDAERQISSVGVKLFAEERRRHAPVQIAVLMSVLESETAGGEVRFDISLIPVVTVHNGIALIKDVHGQFLAIEMARLALGGHT